MARFSPRAYATGTGPRRVSAKVGGRGSNVNVRQRLPARATSPRPWLGPG